MFETVYGVQSEVWVELEQAGKDLDDFFPGMSENSIHGWLLKALLYSIQVIQGIFLGNKTSALLILLSKNLEDLDQLVIRWNNVLARIDHLSFWAWRVWIARITREQY
jgi:hypothetical protein